MKSRFNGKSDRHGEKKRPKDKPAPVNKRGYSCGFIEDREWYQFWQGLDLIEKKAIEVLNSRVILLDPVPENVPSLMPGYRDGFGMLPNPDFRHDESLDRLGLPII